MSSKAGLGKVIVAVLVGGGATAVAGYAGTKVETIQKYPIVTPMLLIGIGLLLARRGRLVAGFSLIGAGGAILGLQLLIKLSSMQTDQPKPAATAGRPTDARGAGATLTDTGNVFHNANILKQQNAMGDLHDAGAFFGQGAKTLMSQQDALGFETG
jgi:hypothetical protein